MRRPPASRSLLGAVLALAAAAAVPAPACAETAAATPIGGEAAPDAMPKLQESAPIRLTDHHGQPFDSAVALKDRPMLVYFGFTHCPDVCPMMLVNLSVAIETLESEGVAADDLGFLFVTLDPARDTVELLSQYAPFFDPRLIGLTGEQAEIDSVAAAWNVDHEIVPGTGPDSYAVDHPPYAFALDREHRVVGYVWHFAAPEKIAAQIHNLL